VNTTDKKGQRGGVLERGEAVGLRIHSLSSKRKNRSLRGKKGRPCQADQLLGMREESCWEKELPGRNGRRKDTGALPIKDRIGLGENQSRPSGTL